MAVAYNNIGIIYYNTGDTTKALGYYGKSVELNQKLEDKQGLAETYLNIASIKKEQGDYKQALEYGQKSLALQRELGNTPELRKVMV
jgi:tetratricopeptide (TPR) repeat protein